MIARVLFFSSSTVSFFAVFGFLILFSSAFLRAWPRLRCAQRSTDQAAAGLLPSRRESTIHATLPTMVRRPDVPALSHSFPLQRVCGKQTKCMLPEKPPRAVASISEGPRWDNKRRKRVEASPERY